MKKFISLIVLAIMVMIPMTVNAAPEFELECKDIDYTTRTKTCTITGKLSGGSSLSKFTAQLELTHLSIQSITAQSPWVDASNGTNLSFTSSSNVTSSSFTVATIVFALDEGLTAQDSCHVVFKPCYDENGTFTCADEPITVSESTTPKCKVEDGKYYGKNGTEVTESVYNDECVKNPGTGKFLPYVVIFSGIALAMVVFNVSRKNNKLYKI